MIVGSDRQTANCMYEKSEESYEITSGVKTPSYRHAFVFCHWRVHVADV